MSTTSLYNDTLLLIDKPAGWTSFDVVKKVRHLLQVKKVGHAGTLDPLATGLLILCTGKKTKEIATYQGFTKSYEGTIGIGHTTPSYDLETPFDTEASYDHLTEADFRTAAKQLTGSQLQMPPAYSAIKSGGIRAYKAARKGVDLPLKPRSIEVETFLLTKIAPPLIDFRITCSKGTYIRSLAYDFGQCLQVGAYLHQLRRTAIGAFHVADAYTLDQLAAKVATQQPLETTSNSLGI